MYALSAASSGLDESSGSIPEVIGSNFRAPTLIDGPVCRLFDLRVICHPCVTVCCNPCVSSNVLYSYPSGVCKGRATSSLLYPKKRFAMLSPASGGPVRTMAPTESVLSSNLRPHGIRLEAGAHSFSLHAACSTLVSSVVLAWTCVVSPAWTMYVVYALQWSM